MDVERSDAGLRLLLDFPGNRRGSADIKLSLDTEALLESAFYSFPEVGANRHRDDNLPLFFGRRDRFFPITGRGWLCLCRIQHVRHKQSEESQSNEPQ